MNKFKNLNVIHTTSADLKVFDKTNLNFYLIWIPIIPLNEIHKNIRFVNKIYLIIKLVIFLKIVKKITFKIVKRI